MHAVFLAAGTVFLEKHPIKYNAKKYEQALWLLFILNSSSSSSSSSSYYYVIVVDVLMLLLLLLLSLLWWVWPFSFSYFWSQHFLTCKKLQQNYSSSDFVTFHSPVDRPWLSDQHQFTLSGRGNRYTSPVSTSDVPPCATTHAEINTPSLRTHSCQRVII